MADHPGMNRHDAGCISDEVNDRKGDESMFGVKVTVKQAGKKRAWLEEQDYVLSRKPETVRELIEQTVSACVEQHNAQIGETQARAALSQEEMEERVQLGRIAFDLPYGDRPADRERAIHTAMEGYRDGLYRIFLNDQLLDEPEDAIDMREGDHLIFIRLVMLAGRRW